MRHLGPEGPAGPAEEVVVGGEEGPHTRGISNYEDTLRIVGARFLTDGEQS